MDDRRHDCRPVDGQARAGLKSTPVETLGYAGLDQRTGPHLTSFYRTSGVKAALHSDLYPALIRSIEPNIRYTCRQATGLRRRQSRLSGNEFVCERYAGTFWR